MYIKVTDYDTMVTIFKGEAEDFYFLSNCDDEIQLILDKMERIEIGKGKTFRLDDRILIFENIYEDEVEVA